MKKVAILVCLLVSLTAVSSAVLTGVTLEWAASVTGLSGNTSCGTYNWATDHFLICDYSAPAVRIANGADGSLTGSNLDLTGTTLGTLGVFAICATSDGVIYGGTNPDPGTGEEQHLIRWADESAAPTQQLPAPLIVETVEEPMRFPRTMDAVGTGVDTVIAVAGNDTYLASLLTTTDGTTFAVTDLVGADEDYARIKQGVALAPSVEKVYGTKADGAGEVAYLQKIDDAWSIGGLWAPPPSYATVATGGLGQASPIGYMENHNAVMVLSVMDAADETLTVLDGLTGSIIQQLQIGQNIGTYGYGAIDLDETTGRGFFNARGSASGIYICGELSFNIYEEPDAAGSSWGLYE